MKKLLLILFTILLLTGCKKIELTEKSIAYTKDYDPITNLKNLPESSTISTELAGDELIYTIVAEDKTTTLSQVVEYNETITIDGTKDVDLSLFYDVTSKVKEYTLNEDKTILTITDENSTFDIPVNLVYPEYTIKQDITIDTYVGYDINDFVNVDDKEVIVSSELDEDNSLLNITLTKNNWSVIETKDVTLTNSSPYPMKFVSRYGWNGVILPFDGILTYTFLSPTEVEAWSYYIGDYPTTVEGDTLVDEWEACKFKIEDDALYYCIDGLGRGAERNVPGSYYYFERVYE